MTSDGRDGKRAVRAAKLAAAREQAGELAGLAIGAGARGLLRIPAGLQQRLSGKPVRLDGLELAADIQLLIKAQGLLPAEPDEVSVAAARAEMEHRRVILLGRTIQPVDTTDLDAGGVPARLYEPVGLAAGRGLLIYFHGGGWVIGDLESHDNLCRFLALRSGVRVLSVDYRLAPEHPFPAAADDAERAFAWAVEHAAELRSDKRRIGVGGDSAGGNLAAVVSQQAVAHDRTKPAFQLLVYPATDFTVKRASRKLFGDGFFLTDGRMDWFEGHYVPPGADKHDPRLSPLLAPDLSGLPPTYLVTAGFDPLRDEGEAYAKKLADAGVDVLLKRQDGLVHGFANMFSLARSAREAMNEAAEALARMSRLAG